MNIQWKQLDGVKHLFAIGETSCEIVGLETSFDNALPCDKCLGVLNKLTDEAFPLLEIDDVVAVAAVKAIRKATTKIRVAASAEKSD
jgi:hypothetical protein